MANNIATTKTKALELPPFNEVALPTPKICECDSENADRRAYKLLGKMNHVH